jgi:hypothetical protein
MNDAELQRMVAWLVARFEADSGVDVRGDDSAMKRIREAAARITTLESSKSSELFPAKSSRRPRRRA